MHHHEQVREQDPSNRTHVATGETVVSHQGLGARPAPRSGRLSSVRHVLSRPVRTPSRTRMSRTGHRRWRFSPRIRHTSAGSFYSPFLQLLRSKPSTRSTRLPAAWSDCVATAPKAPAAPVRRSLRDHSILLASSLAACLAMAPTSPAGAPGTSTDPNHMCDRHFSLPQRSQVPQILTSVSVR